MLLDSELSRKGTAEEDTTCASVRKIQPDRSTASACSGRNGEREMRSVSAELLINLLHYVVAYTNQHAAAG